MAPPRCPGPPLRPRQAASRRPLHGLLASYPEPADRVRTSAGVLRPRQRSRLQAAAPHVLQQLSWRPLSCPQSTASCSLWPYQTGLPRVLQVTLPHVLKQAKHCTPPRQGSLVSSKHCAKRSISTLSHCNLVNSNLLSPSKQGSLVSSKPPGQPVRRLASSGCDNCVKVGRHCVYFWGNHGLHSRLWLVFLGCDDNCVKVGRLIDMTGAAAVYSNAVPCRAALVGKPG